MLTLEKFVAHLLLAYLDAQKGRQTKTAGEGAGEAAGCTALPLITNTHTHTHTYTKALTLMCESHSDSVEMYLIDTNSSQLGSWLTFAVSFVGVANLIAFGCISSFFLFGIACNKMSTLFKSFLTYANF